MKRGGKIELVITVEAPVWRKTWPKLKRDVEDLIARAAAQKPIAAKANGVVTVVLSRDETLQRLNRQFRGKDRPTNVLSFPDETEPLGGIVVSYDTVESESSAQNKAFLNHAKHMILHGFLHLLGYDHQVKRDARLMEGLEVAILKDLGIPNPYLIEKSSA